MAIQAEDASWQDKHYAAEAEKEWKKKEARWSEEAAARERLNAEVAATRAIQAAEKSATFAIDASSDTTQLDSWRRANAAANEKEHAATLARAAMMRQHADDTAAQLAERKAAREQEKGVREPRCACDGVCISSGMRKHS